MKKIILIFLTALLFSACAVTKHRDSLTGQFSGYMSFVGDITLSLHPDGTFNLNSGFDYTGRWEVLDNKNALLRFDEITDLAILLASYTLKGEDVTIKFITPNKILVLPHKDVLKREK